MRGFLAAGNLNIDCLGQYTDMGQCRLYDHSLLKFPQDRVWLNEAEQISFLDGYVHNKAAIDENSAEDWPQRFARAMRKNPAECLRAMRGGFCGFIYDRNSAVLTAYTDQVSVRALYYYADGNRWMVSNHIPFMIAVLRANEAVYHFDETAAKYMLSYGYMLDNSTFVKEIRRLLPGQIVRIADGRIETERYYLIPDREEEISEREAVERIDAAFREAVRREFDKDRECGYRHLVDLSGGLDSRMVSWVAHDMGYTDQLNVTYCQAGYLDDRISKEIAAALGHEYLFQALDDAGWMCDIDEITSKNNGAALYTGITGGNRLLKSLPTEEFGIEHTGMIGDAVLSTFYHDKEFNYGKPRLGYHKYSELLPYRFSDEITREYPCQELFAIYTRGIFGAQSSYMIRQHYVETASPFMDVDFLETVFTLPFAYRDRHHIYLKWMLEKYPQATRFGWEKWGGIKPREDRIFLRKIKTAQRLLQQAACGILGRQNRDSMNPLDYWYQKQPGIQEYCETYYRRHIDHFVLRGDLRDDIARLFAEGNVTEKSMALTVLAIAGAYFQETAI